MTVSGSRLVDRHVFASNASAYDAAWATVACSPALEGTRAGRLEERIPWGTALELAEDAPVLVGGEGVVSPIGQLPLAYLPMDGRAGLSVTGLVRLRGGEDGATARVGTHTLLFDEAAFHAVAGFPLGLFAPGSSGVVPGDWFPSFRRDWVEPSGLLEPLRIPESTARDAFAKARLAALSSLAGWLAGQMGSQQAHRLLASTYHALADAGASKHVVLLSPDDEYPEDRPSWVRNVILLTWLSLPTRDRYSTYFSAEGAGAAFARPILVGSLPDPSQLGPAVHRVRPLPEEDLPTRFVDWARCVIGGGAAFAPLSLRAELRGQSLLDVRSKVVVPGGPPPTAEALIVAVEGEYAGPRREGAMGYRVAEFLRRAPTGEKAAVVRWLAGGPPVMDLPRFADGLVRGLSAEGRELVETPLGARVAARVGMRCRRRDQGVGLLARAITSLFGHGEGVDELVRALEEVARRDGAEAAAEFWRVGLGLMRRFERHESLPSFVSLLGQAPLVDDGTAGVSGVVDDVVQTIRDAGPLGRLPDGPPAASTEGWSAAMTDLWRALAAADADPGREDLHRLAWVEHRRFGRTALSAFASTHSPESRRFVRAFMDRDPALSVFLELRRSALEGLAKEGIGS